MRSKLTALAALVIGAGCGDSARIQPAPPIKNLAGSAPADASPGTKADGGENVHGPRRSDADRKIAEIRANPGYSEELKKQLIEEVERTYKEAQAGFGKK